MQTGLAVICTLVNSNNPYQHTMTMSNSLPETPNTPTELFALQADNEAGIDWSSLVLRLVDDGDISPCESLEIVKAVVKRLHNFHHEVINDEDNDFNSYQLELWETDKKLLGKALRLLRQVEGS